jgi:hypothetical protein
MNLREIYSVIFEIPGRPGYWTEPEGRYVRRHDAGAYARGTKAAKFEIVMSLLLPGERPRPKRGRPLKVVMAAALEILEMLNP